MASGLMNKDWNSYDSAAATHDRLGVPSMFAGPARDLVAVWMPHPAASWLDVGTGSGIVATMAETSRECRNRSFLGNAARWRGRMAYGE